MGKPRVRILLRGLRENGVEVLECHRHIWKGVEDKTQTTTGKKYLTALVWWLAYPGLIFRYLKQPKHDVVLIGYFGLLDVLVLWPFAKLRRTPIIWDAFLSVYDTTVNDRKLLTPRSLLARGLYGVEWLTCRAANLVLLDTATHAKYFIETFKLAPEKVGHVFVGVEPEAFPFFGPRAQQSNATILFYGQFIPLHGVVTIIEAARMVPKDKADWIIIGQGQEANKVSALLKSLPIPNLLWIPWVPYNELTNWIAKANICLGVFGESEKATRVIPNKVFQIIASGKPLITRDSPAIREWLAPDMPGLYLIEPGNPRALADAILLFLNDALPGDKLHASLLDQTRPKTIGKLLVELMNKVVKS